MDLDLLAERVGRKTIVGLERETPLDRLEFNALLPTNGDRRDCRHAVLSIQRRPYTERVERHQRENKNRHPPPASRLGHRNPSVPLRNASTGCPEVRDRKPPRSVSRLVRRADRPCAGTHELFSLPSPMRRFRCSTTAHVQKNSRIILTTFFNVKEFPRATTHAPRRKDRRKS